MPGVPVPVPADRALSWPGQAGPSLMAGGSVLSWDIWRVRGIRLGQRACVPEDTERAGQVVFRE